MISAVHGKLMEYIENQDIAGAAIVVHKGGEVVHRECMGYADIAGGLPVTEDTVFRLASMTKPVIAVGIMMLAEKGLLSIKDPIAKYIPEFAEMKVAARQIAADAENVAKQVAEMDYVPLKRAITIEDLLRHRSGLGHGPVSMMQGVLKTEPGMTLKARAKAIAGCPMDFQPGEGTGYSAVTAFDILGRILEVASGKELTLLLDEMLFAPLGMKDTTFFPDEAMIARVPRLYKRPEKELIDTSAPGEFTNPLGFDFPCGSAGLYATLGDYDKFVQMLACGGEHDGVRLLSEASVAAMAATDPDDPFMANPGEGWGLGMFVFSRRSVSGRYLADGTFGWSGAFGTHFYIDPVNDVSMTFMANRADINGASSYVSWGMEQMIFQGLALKDE